MTKSTTNIKHIQILILSILFTLSFILGGCAQIPPASSPAAHASVPSDTDTGMSVHFIDVGQGDSILVRSEDHAMLIDAGENDQADTVVSYLKQQGVTQLDYVIGTHPHSDHIGGLDKVIHTFSVDKVILPPVEHTTRTFEDVLDSIAAKGLKITKPEPGTSYRLGEASFTILGPVSDYGDDLNNWSVGIRLTYGTNSFVMCGDAETQAEEDMAGSGAKLKADVLKAGHHGSRTSTSDDFLKKVSPDWVVIQCGKKNSYGHPHKETMEKLKKTGCQVLRTDESGTIVAYSDGSNITWNTASAGGPSPTALDTAGETESYVLNTNTGKFHRPECSAAAQMKQENREDVNSSREELIQMGYEPCKQCNP